MEYNTTRNHLVMREYGRHIQKMIEYLMSLEDKEKRQRNAYAGAYYMKLAYNNWHKETVHDDAIQQELSSLTAGQLEFTNTPFVKSFRPNEGRERDRDNRGNTFGDYRSNNNNKRNNQKFQQRNN